MDIHKKIIRHFSRISLSDIASLLKVLPLDAEKEQMRRQTSFRFSKFDIANATLTAAVLLVLSLSLLMSSQALGAGAGITYQGRLIDPSGSPVVGSSVQFKVELKTPGSEDCLLYEEVQTKNLSETSGFFSLSLFDGSGLRTDTSGYNLEGIFANKGTYTFASGQCTIGTSWTPNPADGRRIQVSFNDGTFTAGTWESAPSIAINYVPMAIEAIQVGGYKANQILKLADGVSTTGTEFSNASWTELLALIGGTTTQYLKSGAATFTAAPQWNGVPSGANDLVNKTYVDTLVAAGLPDYGTAGTYTKVVTDIKGRVTSGSTLVEADLPTLSTAGKVSGSAITAGIIGGSTAISSTGNLVTTGMVQGAVVGSTNMRFFNGANYVQLAAPALGSNLSFSLPAADGVAGSLMKTNGSGQLSFGALSSTDIPSLDVAKITTGTLAVARGGTGLSGFGNNSVLVSNGTGSAISSLNCAFGEVIKFDVSGFAGCGTDATGNGSGDFKADGTVAMTGQFKAAIGGNASTPGISFSGDPNTGFWQLANNDQIRIAAGGTEVGGFTTSIFYGGNGSNGNPEIKLTSVGTAAAPTYAFYGYAGNGMFAPGDDIVALSTNGAERVRINASGNVGIGTTNPSSKLSILTNALGETQTDSSGLVLENNTTAIDSGLQQISPAIRWRGYGYANVPIESSLSIDFRAFVVPVQGLAINDSYLTFQSAFNSSGYTDHLAITRSGKVGIGTTNPQAKLEVAGQTRSVNSSGAAQANGAASIDWNNGNAQTLSVDCATTAFTNMLDAGTYILAVTETGTSTCVFSQAGLTFYFSPANGARTSGQRTVYSFQRIGNDVYVSWIKGFQ